MSEQEQQPSVETPAPPHVLVVDDDRRLRDLLGRYLTDQGFRVTTAIDATEARTKLTSVTFDLLVLDIMMPGESGLQLTEHLRQDSHVPILLLTAMGESEDRIKGLSVGADDYLAKPFEPRELVLRIQSILKRAQPLAPAKSLTRHVKFGAFVFDLERRRLTKSGSQIYLTESETDLLAKLAEQPGTPISREELSGIGGGMGASRMIDIQMTRLRKKIEDDPKFPRYLQTVRGRGYVLQPD
ncbi:MAG TPA: response regulator [Terriglobales bacterium]|nr:response regulator [Terriglobales bacterium]